MGRRVTEKNIFKIIRYYVLKRLKTSLAKVVPSNSDKNANIKISETKKMGIK